MSSLQKQLRPFFEIMDSVTSEVARLKQLLNYFDLLSTGSDARFLVGGQLSNLAEELTSLSKEIEN
jgi:hypothetical protein